MADLADALEVLLKHSGVPHESEDRDVVEDVVKAFRDKSADDTPTDDTPTDDTPNGSK